MSLEKRLPLALLLSFVVLFGWGLLQGPAKDTAPGTTPDTTPNPAQGAPAGGAPQGAAASAPAGNGETPDPAANDVAARGATEVVTPSAPQESGLSPEPATVAAPWREWIELGTPGQPGHYHALFDSAGAALLELRSGEYVNALGLEGAERTKRENLAPILVSVRYRDGDTARTKGSLTLSPSSSASGLAPEDLDRVDWAHERLADGVRFTYAAASGVTFVKEIRAVPGANHLALDLRLENVAAVAQAGRPARFVLTASEAVPSEVEDRYYVEPKAVAARVGKEPERVDRDLKGRKSNENLVASSKPGDIAYAGGHSKYFAALLRPASEAAARALVDANARAVFDGDWAAAHPERRLEAYRYVATDAKLELFVPQVGGAATWSYVLYAGPKSADHFGPGDEAFEDLLRADLGMFDGVAGMILKLLRLLHGIFGNWGVAIIVLTLIVRLALFPLNRRMQTAMARHGTKMKRIQPRIDAVKERYKDDPKRLREEQAKIIQQEGAIPPLGGCLPLFIQIPVFFGLFSALRVAFDLRQQPFFLWIEDLAKPDQLMRLGLDLWVLDMTYLNLLPILMVIVWIAQQKVMPKPTDPQALQMHKMMMWMPIIFGVFLYDYAAGLSLYMITSSLWGIAEFTVIRRIWPIDDRELPKKQGGFLAKLAKLQEQAQQMQAQKLKEQQRKDRGGGPGKGPSKGGGKGGGKPD